MWGNKLGWGISAAMVILFVGLVLLVEMSMRVSPPTAMGRDTGNLANVELPVKPQTLVKPGTEPGDAAELYLRAIEEFRTNAFDYTSFMQDSRATLAQGRKLKAIDWLLEARDRSECSGILKSKPELAITYEPSKAIEALRVYGSILSRLGLLAGAAKQTDDAIKFHEAAFVMGMRLADERVVYAQYSAGTGMMGTAAQALKSVYTRNNQTDKATPFEEFDTARVEFEKQTIAPIWRVISSVDPRVIKTHPGDVFAFALEGSDAMWRVEAVMKLGRMKYFASRAGDQRGAKRTVRHLADSDPNPLVRLAASRARDLTIEEYRMIQ